MLEDTENWLYEEGEDQPKHVYEEKLDALKVSFIHSLFLIFLINYNKGSWINCLGSTEVKRWKLRLKWVKICV